MLKYVCFYRYILMYDKRGYRVGPPFGLSRLTTQSSRSSSEEGPKNLSSLFENTS